MLKRLVEWSGWDFQEHKLALVVNVGSKLAVVCCGVLVLEVWEVG